MCNILYADDLVILVPSWLAQQKLLNLCNERFLSLDMNFDVSKSVTMIFEPYKTLCKTVKQAFML